MERKTISGLTKFNLIAFAISGYCQTQQYFFKFYCPKIQAKISGATMVASDSTINFGV